MQLLLINDTSATSNPGCKAVIDTLARGYGSAYPGASMRTLPLGYWAENFRELACRSRDCIVRGDHFPHGTNNAAAVDHAAWSERAKTLAEDDRELRSILRQTHHVVINAEGSVHHNFPRALALLALARTALEQGCTVDMVNGTLQAMDERLLVEVLPHLHHLHVRETCSSEVLQRLEIPHSVAPDVAFAAAFESPPSTAPPAGTCLLTSGVLVRRETLQQQLESITLLGLEPVYLSIGDGGEADLTRKVCEEAGQRWIAADSIPWKELLSFLAGFEFAVSGRHHINIFLCLAGVPFIPLPSNTWKIEATLELVNYPILPCPDGDSLFHALERLRDPGQRTRASEAALNAGQTGREAAEAWLSRIHQQD